MTKRVNTKWWEFLKELSHFGIDTCLAKQYEEHLKDIPHELYETEEGKFSCYIDAVNRTMSPSSFSDVKVPWNSNTWLEEFDKW